jgi:hypothetical protein
MAGVVIWYGSNFFNPKHREGPSIPVGEAPTGHGSLSPAEDYNRLVSNILDRDFNQTSSKQCFFVIQPRWADDSYRVIASWLPQDSESGPVSIEIGTPQGTVKAFRENVGRLIKATNALGGTHTKFDTRSYILIMPYHTTEQTQNQMYLIRGDTTDDELVMIRRMLLTNEYWVQVVNDDIFDWGEFIISICWMRHG